MGLQKVKVGKYTITSMIATGGMGKIYKAKHPTLNRDVILKRLTLVGNKTINERFKREAQLMIDFREDHIVQVYDHFKEGASYYIVMEYVDGIALGDLIDKHRYLPGDVAIMIFYEICKALKYAHDKGVIHRDIKPENILISKDGSVKLTDFGIATSKDCQDECLTRNMILGTPAYMAPEQIDDSSSVDKRADIYSMGVLLYKMVTGKCPFPGNMTPETISLITKGKYKLPKKVNPKVSSFLQRIIVKSMHRNAYRRYSDLGELIYKLDGLLKKLKSSEKIKEHLRLFIFGSPANGKTKRIKKEEILFTKGKGKKKIIVAAISFLILIVMAGAAFYKGYHYEVFQSDKFGAFKIDIAIEKRHGENLRFVKSELFRKGKKQYESVDESNISFKKEESENDKEHFYSSGRLYGKSGQYRAVITINNSIYTRDFFLKSRTIQKAENGNSSGHVISIKHRSTRPRPLALKFNVRDGVTGENITDSAQMFIYFYRRWRKWEDIKEKEELMERIRSGRKHTFLFKHKNYISKIVRIPLKRYEIKVDLSVNLIPVPGTLYVKSNQEGVNFMVNNASHYIQGEETEKL